MGCEGIGALVAVGRLVSGLARERPAADLRATEEIPATVSVPASSTTAPAPA
jgi:hypothetical protein